MNCKVRKIGIGDVTKPKLGQIVAPKRSNFNISGANGFVNLKMDQKITAGVGENIAILGSGVHLALSLPSQKHALVSARLKKTTLDPRNLNSYRPISNL